MAGLSRPELARALVVMLLVIGTTAFFNLYERYEPVGKELLVDPNFKEGFSRWLQSGRGAAEIINGDVVLRATAPAADVAVRQIIKNPSRFSQLRLSAELEATDIRPGPRFWQRGYLALVSFDDDKRMLQVPHVAAHLEGTKAWKSYSAVFRVPEAADELRVSVQLIGATGTLAFRNLSLQEVAERPSYGVLRGSWLIVWIVALTWLLIPYLSHLRFDLPHALACLILVGIFAGTLMPVSFKVFVESWLGNVILQLMQFLGVEAPSAIGPSPENLAVHEPMLDKLGHLLFFGLLGLVARWAYPRLSRSSVVLVLLTLACVSETLQFFVDGRSARISDLLIDAAGVTLGVLVFDGVRWAASGSRSQ